MQVIKNTLIVSALIVVAFTIVSVISVKFANAQTVYLNDNFNSYSAGNVTSPWNAQTGSPQIETGGLFNSLGLRLNVSDTADFEFSPDLTSTELSVLYWTKVNDISSAGSDAFGTGVGFGETFNSSIGSNAKTPLMRHRRGGSTSYCVAPSPSNLTGNSESCFAEGGSTFWTRITVAPASVGSTTIGYCTKVWATSAMEPSGCTYYNTNVSPQTDRGRWAFSANSSMDIMFDSISITATDEPLPVLGSTRIETILSPEINEVTSSTTVSLQVAYISDIPAPSEVCFALQDLTYGQSLDAICDDITQTGEFTFSTTTVLVSGHQYNLWAFLRDSEGNILSTTGTTPRNFYVISVPDSIINPDNGWGVNPFPITGTSTTGLCDVIDSGIPRSFCNLASFLFTPDAQSRSNLMNAYNNLDSKIPFSILQEFSQAFEELDTESRPDKSFNFYWNGEEIPVVASSTFQLYFGDDSAGTIRYWIAVALWLGLAVLLYFRVTKLI